MNMIKLVTNKLVKKEAWYPYGSKSEWQVMIA